MADWGGTGRKMQVQRLWSSSGLGLFEEHPGTPYGKNRVNRGGKDDEGQKVWGLQGQIM